jgi:ribosomal silencing factor RsfS
MLTPEEVRDSLVSQGAENVIVLALKENIDTISHFVIGSGRSHRHIRKMSESVVIAVSIKENNLPRCLIDNVFFQVERSSPSLCFGSWRSGRRE